MICLPRTSSMVSSEMPTSRHLSRPSLSFPPARKAIMVQGTTTMRFPGFLRTEQNDTQQLVDPVALSSELQSFPPCADLQSLTADVGGPD